jgi:hypothetical protein
MNFSRLFWICVIPIVLCPACGKDESKENGQLISFTSLRDKVVERAGNGELTPSSSGIISLPSDLKAASNDGQAYMSKDANAGLLIAFNMSINPHRKEYLLYAERDLPQNSTSIQVGPLNLTIAGKGDDHWYRTIAR